MLSRVKTFARTPMIRNPIQPNVRVLWTLFGQGPPYPKALFRKNMCLSCL